MIGGVANIPSIEEAAEKDPIKEIVISIAGPLVNIFLATVIFIFFGPAINISGFEEGAEMPWYMSMMGVLLMINIFMAVYNLVPAFPMDGGRILRGILGLFFHFNKASMVSGAVGIVAHTVLIAVGIIISQWFMVIISALLVLVCAGFFLKYREKERTRLDNLSQKG